MLEKLLYDTFTGLLTMFKEFKNEVKDYEPKYIKDEQITKQLIEKYEIDKIAKDGNDLEKILNLLEWLSRNVMHNGGMLATYKGKIDSISLLEYSFNKDVEYGLNCLYLSYVLSECLVALDIKARPIFMMPASPYDTDNHVVVSAYSTFLNKWIMIDPTYGSYFLNEEGTILNVLEIRESLSNRINPLINEGYFYNDYSIEHTLQVKAMYHGYIAKNSFAYYTFEEIKQGTINKSRRVEICPIGYSVSERYKSMGHDDASKKTFNYLHIGSLLK